MPAKYFVLSFLFLTLSCSSNDDVKVVSEDDPVLPQAMYFPPLTGSEWEQVSVEELQWNQAAVQPLLDYLSEKNTKAFILLKNGRIVIEEYFQGTNQATNLPWFSAGKTLTAFTVGLAQQEDHLNINNSTSSYLGSGWTSLTPEQEAMITVRTQLTMTTGLDYTLGNLGCTAPSCLQFLNPPGTMWYYHNAPYTLLTDVLEAATPSGFNSYFNSKLRDPIGMNGNWINLGPNKVYYSTARSMARFGLLNLNGGKWDTNVIMEDNNYFNQMTNTSQDLNKAYGYLWWLNGKESLMVPGSELVFQQKLIPSAPDDLIAGLGLNDQKLYVVPTLGLVVIRMGDSSGETTLAPSGLDEQLWQRLTDLWE